MDEALLTGNFPRWTVQHWACPTTWSYTFIWGMLSIFIMWMIVIMIFLHHKWGWFWINFGAPPFSVKKEKKGMSSIENSVLTSLGTYKNLCHMFESKQVLIGEHKDQKGGILVAFSFYTFVSMQSFFCYPLYHMIVFSSENHLEWPKQKLDGWYWLDAWYCHLHSLT